MVKYTITGDYLFLEVVGAHKFWALKSELKIPLEHIKGVHADPKPAMGWFQGLKIAGTDLPNLFRAGMFWQDGNKVFWDVRHAEKTIVIEMEDESCAKQIIEVNNQEVAIMKIRQAITDYSASKAAEVNELDAFLQNQAPILNLTKKEADEIVDQNS